MSEQTWPAWMPEPPFAYGHLGMVRDRYERAKAADPALRRVVTRTATGPTPDFEALRPALHEAFPLPEDDDAEC